MLTTDMREKPLYCLALGVRFYVLKNFQWCQSHDPAFRGLIVCGEEGPASSEASAFWDMARVARSNVLGGV